MILIVELRLLTFQDVGQNKVVMNNQQIDLGMNLLAVILNPTVRPGTKTSKETTHR